MVFFFKVFCGKLVLSYRKQVERGTYKYNNPLLIDTFAIKYALQLNVEKKLMSKKRRCNYIVTKSF